MGREGFHGKVKGESENEKRRRIYRVVPPKKDIEGTLECCSPICTTKKILHEKETFLAFFLCR